MFARARPVAVVSGAIGLLLLANGCDGCSRREKPVETEREEEAVERGRRCTGPDDCLDRDPCTRHECVDERCVVSLAPSGTSCDNETVCDGVAACDANGRCIAGRPPLVDDGNECTIDSCDPKRGVLHEPIPIDDMDACTEDSCDRATGAIAHKTLPLDDGNDCTKDSCDPRTGVKHEPANGSYTCDARCPAGSHVASRSRSPECGSSQAMRSFCAPSCGPSFHTCDTSCPTGYRKSAASPGGTCGTNPSVMTFCVKG